MVRIDIWSGFYYDKIEIINWEKIMCEANAYLLKEGKEELILEAVDKVESEGNQIRIESIFGEQKVVSGQIRSMSLLDHKILIEG